MVCCPAVVVAVVVVDLWVALALAYVSKFDACIDIIFYLFKWII